MHINIDISGGQISCINSDENVANIIIDLTQVWGMLANHYTDLLVEAKLQIPTLEVQLDHTSIKTLTETEMSKIFKISEIKEQKVNFEIGYPGILDETRLPVGTAKILGYTTKIMD